MAKARSKRPRPRNKYIKIIQDCPFCKEKKEADYKNPEGLKKFTTSRGKILRREKTGTCNKHQRRLKIAIKRARFLSLLPFAKRI